MKLFLDCEFNGFDGELLSIGIAPEDADASPFYMAVEHNDKAYHPWVAVNVVPHLGYLFDRETTGRTLAKYLTRFENPVVIADWPEDIIHFNKAFLLGKGLMIPVESYTCVYHRIPGFVTADHSKVPHHALYDAMALRDAYKAQNK